MTLRPNVVLFITHDTGRHVSPYGVGTVHTPHCERLAREGLRFTQAFCTSPLCSPSRAALVTGRYPHQNGVRGLTGRLTGGFDLYPTERHAAQLFSSAGYESVLCGFEHETPNWQRCGFERTISGSGGMYNHSGDLREHGREIGGWLAARERGRPFYLQIGCHETHRAFTAFDTPPDTSLGLTIPDYLNDLPAVREEVAAFQGAVRRLDDGLGHILAALDAHGVADDTLFVFTTDHGIDFPRAKGTLYDAGTGVFLFIRYPRAGWGAGRTIDALTSHVDLLPTLLEACGIQRPDDLAGDSLVPVLRDVSLPPRRDAVFAEKCFHDTFDPTRSIRTRSHLYIRYFDVNLFQDLRLATMTRRDFFKHSWRRTGIEELYDLASDPGQVQNLAEEPAAAPVLEAMRGRLVEWMDETGDPLLEHKSGSPYYSQALADLLRYRGGASAARAETSGAASA